MPTSAPTPDCLRVCSGTICDQETCACTQYELTPPGDNTDRVCQALTVCTSDEYESKAPTKRLTNQDSLAYEFYYINDRECTGFADHDTGIGSVQDLCGQTCDDRPGSTNGCDDGGADSVTSACSWGSDCRDCGNRVYDDCLPFYHEKVLQSSTDGWQGQFWNDRTVACQLPDAVVSTSRSGSTTSDGNPLTAGRAYAEIQMNHGLTWPFLTPAAPVPGATSYTPGHFVAACSDSDTSESCGRTLSAVDNFFSSGTNLPSWGKPVNRALVTVTQKSNDRVIGNSASASTDSTTSRFKVADTPFNQLRPCYDANALGATNLPEYDPTLRYSADRGGDLIGPWQSGVDRGCDDYEINGFYCALYGTEMSGNGLRANQACCACGGGVRPNGNTLVVTTRDPFADGQSFDIQEGTGSNLDDPPETTETQPETTEHSTAHYDPPSWSNDWVDDDCTAQRVDTW